MRSRRQSSRSNAQVLLSLLPSRYFRVRGSNLALIAFSVNGIKDRRLQLRGLAVLVPGGVTSRLITDQFTGVKRS